MNDILSLLFSFAGRIPRSRFWIGFLITGAITVAGSFILNPTAFTEGAGHATVPDTIWQLLMVVPLTALSVKRFNDRDWPWWPGYASNALAAIFIGADRFGYVGMIERSPLLVVFLLVVFCVVLLAFADNAFLKGTTGPNRYGPDPLDQTIS